MIDTSFLETNLRKLLPVVDPASQQWMDIARDERWAGWVGPDWVPVLRPETSVISRPAHFIFMGAGGEISLTLDLAQWPELTAIAGLADPSRRDLAARIVLSDVMARINAAGCPVESCTVLDEQNPAAQGRKRIPLRIGHFDVDLYPDERAQPLAPFSRPTSATQHVVALSAADLSFMGNWVLATRLVIGQRQIPRDRLARLRVGDVVLGGLDGTGRLEIVCGGGTRVCASGRLTDEGRMTMTEELHEDFEDSMDGEDDFDEQGQDDLEEGFGGDFDDELEDGFDDGTHAENARLSGRHSLPAGSAGAAGNTDNAAGRDSEAGMQAMLARMPMDVRYEITGPQLTVARASRLGEGDVLILPVSASKAVVRLRCQGRTVALGELVCIGEHLGVRITSTGSSNV